MLSMKAGGIWHQSWLAVANFSAALPLLTRRPSVLQAACGVSFCFVFWAAR